MEKLKSFCSCNSDWLQTARDTDGVITLNYSYLKELPCGRLCSQHRNLVKIFYMKRNILSGLPEDISTHYPSLTELYLPSNKISCLPECIGNLSELKSLNFCENLLTLLPESFFSLRKLRILVLRDNLLDELPEGIGCFSQLRMLDASNNRLKSVPSSIGECKNLEHLLLTHNKLKVIPRQVCALPNLEQLSLSSNDLIFLPIDICNERQAKLRVEVENNPALFYSSSHLSENPHHYIGCAQNTPGKNKHASSGFHNISLKVPGDENDVVLGCPIYVHDCSHIPAVPSLLECCSRCVYKFVKDKIIHLDHRELPINLYYRVATPLGCCYGCSKQIFWSVGLRVDKTLLPIQRNVLLSPHKFYIVSYFCSSVCSHVETQ